MMCVLIMGTFIFTNFSDVVFSSNHCQSCRQGSGCLIKGSSKNDDMCLDVVSAGMLPIHFTRRMSDVYYRMKFKSLISLGEDLSEKDLNAPRRDL